MKQLNEKDLRIGNFVKYASGGNIFEIDEIHQKGLQVHDSVEYTWIEIEEFEPIQLTEEWLTKIGFSLVKYLQNATYEKEFRNDPQSFKVWLRPIDGILYRVELKHGIRGFYIPPISGVHQLQNLWHSLTGTELQLNELLTL